MFVLTLAGVGRGFAAGSNTVEPGSSIPGVAFHICHTGPGDGSPVDPAQHDCCDACALCAPVTLAAVPSLIGPASVVHFVAHVKALAWVPIPARFRTPRQAQGPPTA